MTEELQGLLDRIQQDGVEKARARGEELLAAAREEAERIGAEAREQAGNLLKEAERNSAASAERGRKALDQAARDVMLSLEERIAAALRELVGRELPDALTPAALADMLAVAVKNYCDGEGSSGRLEVLLNQEQQKAVRDHFMKRFSEELREGVDIKGDDDVVSGFRISVVDNKVHHDFSGDALADAVCALLRPDLSEIIRGAKE